MYNISDIEIGTVRAFIVSPESYEAGRKTRLSREFYRLNEANFRRVRKSVQ